MLVELQQLFSAKRDTLIRLSAQRDAIAAQHDNMLTKIAGYRELVGICRKAGAVFQALSDEESCKFQTNLRRLVTAGLQVVFDEDMEFDIEVGVERNVMSVNFYVSSIINGQKIKLDIMSAKGGGVADVVSFLLQFLLVYYLPNRQRVIIGDEPWKNLSQDYKLRFAEFVKAICAKSGVQIIMVTHDVAYSDIADKVYEFSLNDRGLTNVTTIK